MLFRIISLPPDVQASLISSETKALSNNIIKNLYFDIYDHKVRYDELRNFDEQAFYENRLGIYAIVYDYKDPLKQAWRQPYSFGVTITSIEDPLFHDQLGGFDYRYPLLGIKLTGYQPRYLRRSQFDLLPLLEPYRRQLSDQQQERLPLRLFIEPVKEKFRVGHPIEFDAVLKNTGKKHIYVKPLGSKTLYFKLNDAQWGTRPARYDAGGKRIILHVGEELRTRFEGQGYTWPGKVFIRGVYNLGFEGVRPSARVAIEIVDN